PWGIAYIQNFWVSNNRNGTSSFFTPNGTPQALIINIPSVDSLTGGAPTGIVANTNDNDFIINGVSARFIFACEDGTLAAWVGGTQAVKVAVAPRANASYKGVALLNFQLYATDFYHNTIDIYDNGFKYVSSFTDGTIPPGYGPFGIQAIGNKLYITYARQNAAQTNDSAGVGIGYVDVCDAGGKNLKSFVS